LKQLNVAQQELAQQLLTGVKGWVQSVGQGLLRDLRTKLAQPNPLIQQRQKAKLGKRGRGKQQEQEQQQQRQEVAEEGRGAEQWLKGGFYEVGRWAASGACWRLEDLLNKARVAANSIRWVFHRWLRAAWSATR
jgi:hypothetical protein